MREAKIAAIVGVILVVCTLQIVAQENASGPELTVQLGHPSSVTSVAFSPDGRHMLTGSGDNTAKLWEFDTGREVRTFSGHSGGVSSVAFSPDGRYALTGSWDDTAKLWEVATGREVRSFVGHSRGRHAGVLSVAFSPDGRYAVTGSRDRSVDGQASAKLWDVESGRELRTFSGHSDNVNSVAFSPDGRYVLTAGRNYNPIRDTAKLYDVESGRELRTFSGHSGEVNSVAFSPDGRSVLTGSYDKTAKLWDVESGRELRTFTGHPNSVESVAISPDGRYALTGSHDETARLWDVESGRELRTFAGHVWRGPYIFNRTTHTIFAVAFSVDGRYALTGSNDRTAKLWDVESGRELRTLSGYSSGMSSGAFSLDGRYALTGGYDSDPTAKLWDAESGRELRTFSGHSEEVGSVAISSDGRYALTGSGDDTARLWDVESGQELRTFTGHSSSVNSVAFSPDGRYALTGSNDRTAKLWEADTGREVRTFSGSFGQAIAVAFRPDGRYVLISGTQNETTLWNVQSGREVIRLDGHRFAVSSLEFSLDGRSVLTGSIDGTANLWDLESGRELRTFSGHSRVVNSVAFSPNGRHVLTGSGDGTAKLWDVESGRELRTFSEHSSPVNSAGFSPDGRHVLTVSGDGTMRYRNAETGEEIYAAMATADGRSLTWTPEGYFSGDQQLARDAVYFVDGMRTIGIDQFFDQYYRPDIVEAKIAGRDVTELVGTRTAAESIVPLPEVSIEVERRAGVFRGLSREGMGTAADAAADYHVVNGAIRVRVTARDTGGGAEEIRLFHNGARVAGDTRGLAAVGRPQATGSGELVQEFTIRLADGENTLRAIAFSETRIESSPAVIELAYQAPRRVEPTLWVLAVGINEYRNPRYNLNYAVADAQGFVEAVEHSSGGLFTETETEIITDADATRENIIAAFERIEARAAPEDLFMFFYGGHGIVLHEQGDAQGVFHFVTPGVTQMTRPDLVTRLGISSPELSELVARLPPRRHFMVIDACYAGAALGDFAFRGAAEEQALARLQRASGTAMLAASREDQFAQEFPILGQGALTRTVIDGLMGAAGPAQGQITVLDILRYADEQVPLLTEQHLGQPQFPQFFSPPQNFPVGVR